MGHPDMHDVIQLYQYKVAPLSGVQRDKLYQACDEGVSPFVIGCAILKAKQEQKRKKQAGRQSRIGFKYIWRILEDWIDHGLTTEEALRDYLNSQQAQNGQGRDTYAQSFARKIARKDFTYTMPRPPKKGEFSFLDD